MYPELWWIANDQENPNATNIITQITAKDQAGGLNFTFEPALFPIGHPALVEKPIMRGKHIQSISQ